MNNVDVSDLSLKRKRDDIDIKLESVIDCFDGMMIIPKKMKMNVDKLDRLIVVPKRRKVRTECNECEIVSENNKKCLNCDNNFCLDCYDECKCGDCVTCCKGVFCSNCNVRNCEKVDDIFTCTICEYKFCEDCRYVSSGLEVCHECVWSY